MDDLQAALDARALSAHKGERKHAPPSVTVQGPEATANVDGAVLSIAAQMNDPRTASSAKSSGARSKSPPTTAPGNWPQVCKSTMHYFVLAGTLRTLTQTCSCLITLTAGARLAKFLGAASRPRL